MGVYNEKIRQNVLALMKEHGLSQKEFAEILGQSVSAVQKKAPTQGGAATLDFTLDDIVCICDHFGLSTDTLLGRDLHPSMSLSDILEFLFNVSRQYQVVVISDPSGILYEDFDESLLPSDPYSLYGVALKVKEWNDAVEAWSALAGSGLPKELLKKSKSFVEKGLLEEYRNVLPDSKMKKGMRGVSYTVPDPATVEKKLQAETQRQGSNEE